MRMHCLARREGPAFFDEDDVCAGFRIFDTACLNCHHQKSRAAVRRQPCCSLVSISADLSCPIEEGHDLSAGAVLINTERAFLRSGRIPRRNLILVTPENGFIEGMVLGDILER